MDQATYPNLTRDADRKRIVRLELIDSRLRWLSSWIIHNANHLRESRDG